LDLLLEKFVGEGKVTHLSLGCVILLGEEIAYF